MIEVHLYGRLRRYGPTSEVSVPCVVCAQVGADQRTVGDFLVALGVPSREVGSVFCDGRWAREGLDAPIHGVMRLGLFPRDMALLYV